MLRINVFGCLWLFKWQDGYLHSLRWLPAEKSSPESSSSSKMQSKGHLVKENLDMNTSSATSYLGSPGMLLNLSKSRCSFPNS
jgi:hypothetical protein